MEWRIFCFISNDCFQIQKDDKIVIFITQKINLKITNHKFSHVFGIYHWKHIFRNILGQALLSFRSLCAGLSVKLMPKRNKSIHTRKTVYINRMLENNSLHNKRRLCCRRVGRKWMQTGFWNSFQNHFEMKYIFYRKHLINSIKKNWSPNSTENFLKYHSSNKKKKLNDYKPYFNLINP